MLRFVTLITADTIIIIRCSNYSSWLHIYLLYP